MDAVVSGFDRDLMDQVRFAQPVEKLQASKFQEGVTRLAGYSSWFLKEAIALGFRCTRKLPKQEYFGEVTDRVKRVAVATLPFVASSFVWLKLGGSLSSLGLATGGAFIAAPIALYAAAAFGSGRFKMVGFESESSLQDNSNRQQLKITTWNSALQRPWSDWTAGVEQPNEILTGSSTRVDEFIRIHSKDKVDIFAGQEFEDQMAVDRFIDLASQNGYKCIWDMGSGGLINSSGLFFMIKKEIAVKSIKFTPFPDSIRTGLAVGSRQGVLQITVQLNGKNLTIFNTHLNYGSQSTHQESRNKEMQIIARLIQDAEKNGEVLLLGDINFDTNKYPLADFGLGNYKNELGGVISCSDIGKHEFRGASLDTESDDAIIFNQGKLKVSSGEEIAQFIRTANQKLLSDHTKNTFVVELV